jgi:tetrahydromethanopterin S-methyltransferase subunit G
VFFFPQVLVSGDDYNALEQRLHLEPSRKKLNL